MHQLKIIGLALLEFARQLWLFPQAVVAAFRGRRGREASSALDLERLDRIRNPNKYLDRVNEKEPPE